MLGVGTRMSRNAMLASRFYFNWFLAKYFQTPLRERVNSDKRIGEMVDWKPILTWWSSVLMSSDLARHVSPPPDSSDWLGFEPATEHDIETLEARLGLILPPSYRSFLLTTNGWRVTSHAIYRVRPAAEVDFFRVENEQWVELYAESGWEVDDLEYYCYPDGMRTGPPRGPHAIVGSDFRRE